MKNKKRLHHLFQTLFALSLFHCLQIHAASADVEMATDHLLTAGATGFSMALINQDGIYWSESQGYADLETKRPMSINTVMNIASISKTITGTSLMMLVEQGKLDLDRDMNDYLPFRVAHPGHPESPITTRQLLTHSSAIVDRADLYNSYIMYFPGADNPISLGDFVTAYLSADGRFYDPANFAGYPPGTERQYSNIGYGLAAYLVELLSGEPLNQFSAKNIFAPLEMTSTGWMFSEIDRNQHASLYEWSDGETKPVTWYGLATWPDGGVRTSLQDLSKFYAAIINGGELAGTRILQEATVQGMFQPQFVAGQVLEAVTDGDNHQQAITWSYRTGQTGLTVVGHSGSDPGVTTHAYFNRETGTGAILLVNTSSEDDAFNQAVIGLLRALLSTAVTEH